MFEYRIQMQQSRVICQKVVSAFFTNLRKLDFSVSLLSGFDIFIYTKMALTHFIAFCQANPTYMPVLTTDPLLEIYLPLYHLRPYGL